MKRANLEIFKYNFRDDIKILNWSNKKTLSYQLENI